MVPDMFMSFVTGIFLTSLEALSHCADAPTPSACEGVRRSSSNKAVPSPALAAATVRTHTTQRSACDKPEAE